jgi:hypothetical protein
MLKNVQVHQSIAVCSRSDTKNPLGSEEEASELLRNALTLLSNSETELHAVMLVVGGDAARMPSAASCLVCGNVEFVDESNGPLPLSWLAAFIVRMELWSHGNGHLVAFFEMGHTCIAALLYKVRRLFRSSMLQTARL